ncbi:retrovirus-related pol polyprotein from transposon TNT 1-94 [Tanacetum coccineum]
MSTLVEFMILSGGDNRPPMLEKHLYDSWKRRIELYMQNREHGRMILESVEHGPLIWSTIEENGVTRTKKYEELSATEKIQADCDLKETNIILQGLPSDVYSLVNHHRVAKDLWERVQLLMQVNQQTHLAEFPQIDSGLSVPVFKQGDDPIDTINKMMSFLSTDVTSRFPTTNNQLRNSSNPRQQATIHDRRVIVQPVQERQSSIATGEGHMARQCPKPKRKRDATWFRDKVLLVEAQGSDDLDAYDSDCDDFSTANAVLMANLSSYGSDVLSKYLLETQNAAVHATNSSAQQDAMILYVFEQLSYQVTNCNNVNKDNLIANESLFAELKRYKERVKLLEERQNVNLSTREKLIMDDVIREKNAQFADFEKEINYLKQTLSDQSNENELLIKTFNVLKNESKEKKAKNIDKEIALEKKVNIKPINYAKLNRLSKDFDIMNIVVNSSVDMNTSVNVHSFIAMNDSVNYVEMKRFCHNSIKNDLRKLKGKDIVDNAAQVSNATNIAPGMYKIDPVTLAPKDKNNIETHIYYLKHTMEQVAILREIVEQAKSLNPLDSISYSTCKYVKLIQELLGYVRDTCPNIHKPSEILVAVTPINKKKTVSRSTKSSRSKSTDNTKNDRILQISSSTQKKNKVEDHSRIVKSCLNKPNCVVEPSGNANVQHSKLNTNSELMCVKCNSSMFDARHELCFLEFVSDMNASSKSKSVKKAKKKEEWKPTGKVFTKIGYNWRPTGRTFTLVGNACPLTRITATNKVPLREPIPLEVVAQESVVTKVYTRRPKVPKTNGSNSKPKIAKSMISNKMEPDTSRGSNTLVAPSSSSSRSLGQIVFVVIWTRMLQATMTRDSYQLTNFSAQVYRISGEGRTETKPLYIVNRGYNGVFSNLSLVQSLKDQILVMAPTIVTFELCINGKKYILVIVDNYSRFIWVKFLASKDEAPDFIIKFLKMIQVRLNAPVRNIRTNNGNELVNQTLRSYYESVGISHETSVARSPQQNGIVEKRNHTLVEVAQTMLIYVKAHLFLWTDVVATACYTQNRSIIRRRHRKTPYELLHDRKPDLSYLYVFGALCYPNNDSEDFGKLQSKADIGIFIGYAPKKKA